MNDITLFNQHIDNNYIIYTNLSLYKRRKFTVRFTSKPLRTGVPHEASNMKIKTNVKNTNNKYALRVQHPLYHDSCDLFPDNHGRGTDRFSIQHLVLPAPLNLRSTSNICGHTF